MLDLNETLIELFILVGVFGNVWLNYLIWRGKSK
jgi:hypothetical protein